MTDERNLEVRVLSNYKDVKQVLKHKVKLARMVKENLVIGFHAKVLAFMLLVHGISSIF